MAGYGRREPTGWEMAMQGMNFLSNSMEAGQRIGENRYQADERDGVNKALEHIAEKLGSTGDISALDGDPILNTRHGTMAVGQFMGQRANTETSRLQMLKSMEAADNQFYQNTFRPMAFAAQDAFKAGDMQRFAGIAGELSAKSPMPFRLIPGQDGNFNVEFRSDAAGGWTDTGRKLSPQQAMDEIGNIIGGEQTILAGADMQPHQVNPRFLAAAARYKMGTIAGNAQAMADPKRWITLTKGGNNISVIPQNRHDDYSAGPSYRIVDEKGGMSGMVGSLDDLLSQGWTRADVDADIKNKQRIAAGKGAGGVGGVAGGLGTKDLHVRILEAGYAYDSTNKWYFKIAVDEEGKAKADLSRPLTREQHQEIALKSKAVSQGVNNGDILDIRDSVQNAAQQIRHAPPNIPQQQAPPAPPAQNRYAGQLINYPKNGFTQWAIIGEDGQPQEVSPEEAKRHGQAQPQAVEAPSAQAAPRKPRVNINDVLAELTPEELAHWKNTGKLPERYNQIR